MAKTTIPGALVVVTGAGSGIGRATSLAFAAEGAKVLCVDVNESSAKETADMLGTGHHAYAVDVADPDAMVELAALVEREHGVPNVVVNNAGIGMSGRFLDMAQGDWDLILGINLRGVINGCAAFGPAMVARGSGQVVNTSSGLGYIPAADTPAYCTTKAGVLHFSRCLRADWSAKGVGVSVICPGVINTPIATNTHYLGPNREKTKQLAQMGFSRAHAPETVAKAIVSAARHNRSIVPVGAESWLGWWLVRLVPTPILDAVGSIASRVSTRRTRG
jgi:NAD(P)-dependent dehydrogenase (short-subunit alcohol dehydrogenase family)